MRRVFGVVLVVALGGVSAAAWSAEPAKKAPQIDPAVQRPRRSRAAKRGGRRQSGRAENLQKAVANRPRMPPPTGNWARCGSTANGSRPDQAQEDRRRRQAAGGISHAAGPERIDRGQPGCPGPLVPEKQARRRGARPLADRFATPAGQPRGDPGPRAEALRGHVADAGADPAGQGPNTEAEKGRGSLAAAGGPVAQRGRRVTRRPRRRKCGTSSPRSPTRWRWSPWSGPCGRRSAPSGTRRRIMPCSFRWSQMLDENPHPVAAEFLTRLAVFSDGGGHPRGGHQGPEEASAGSLCAAAAFRAANADRGRVRNIRWPPTAT